MKSESDLERRADEDVRAVDALDDDDSARHVDGEAVRSRVVGFGDGGLALGRHAGLGTSRRRGERASPALRVALAASTLDPTREPRARRCVAAGNRLARDAVNRLEGRRAGPRVARREREALRVSPALGPGRHVPRAGLRIPCEHRDAGHAARAETGGGDLVAALRVARLGGVERAAGVPQERVVADPLEGIAQERVDPRMRSDARLDRREALDVRLEVARQRRRIGARALATVGLDAGAGAGGRSDADRSLRRTVIAGR